MTALNHIERIHFIGIGGISMSGLAEIMLEDGYEVTGSDINDNAIEGRLRNHGAKITIPHCAEAVEGADLIVYTAAIKQDNVEMVHAKELGIPMMERSTFLGQVMKKYNYGIAISGCHGKTTTTSMVSLVFNNAKMDPTILVGGELDAIGGNVRVGKSDYFITEACEYVESFLKFYPFVAVILNIEADHLDYFRDIDHIISAFEKFVRLVPKDGYLFMNADNENTVKASQAADCNVIQFGLNHPADYQGSNITYDEKGRASFDVTYHRESLGRFTLHVPGFHNVMNALATVAICHNCGIPADLIRSSLLDYTGAHRRFDVKGVKNGITIVDDYAHHPTEIQATLHTAKQLEHHRIWCVFQPHTYTRTKTLFEGFVQSFSDADNVIITDIYAAREKDTGMVNAQQLVDGINANHANAIFVSDFDEIATRIASQALPGDIVLTVGAGSITKLGDMILNRLPEAPMVEELSILEPVIA